MRQWKESLIPTDVHGKLVSVVGKDPWHHDVAGGAEAWNQDIDQLAHQLVQQPNVLAVELDWLCSDHARSAPALGLAMGRHDSQAVCLDAIVKAAARTRGTGLARTYVGSLLKEHPEHGEAVTKLLDELDQQVPEVAYGLALESGNSSQALTRALRLIDAGQLQPEWLGAFRLPMYSQNLSPDDFRELLTRLVGPAGSGNTRAAQVALDVVAFRLWDDQRQQRTPLTQDTGIQTILWEVLEATADTGGGDPHRWCEVLEAMADFDPERAARP